MNGKILSILKIYLNPLFHVKMNHIIIFMAV
nr:MAG TPA: hypothetical protein [Caudoviricetes sp.]